jgi:hypothetical protein
MGKRKERKDIMIEKKKEGIVRKRIVRKIERIMFPLSFFTQIIWKRIKKTYSL